MEFETVFHGVFDRFLWRDLESSASIFLFKTREKIYDKRYYREQRNGWFVLSCVSFKDVVFPSFEEGCPIAIAGHYLNSKKGNNYDFEITMVEIERQLTDDVKVYLSRYLSKESIQKLSAFADPVFRACGYARREKGQAYSGISQQDSIEGNTTEKLIEMVTESALAAACSSTRVPYPHIKRICMRYRSGTMDFLKKNPYRVCYDMDIPFRTADRIAQKLGFKDDNIRERAAIDEVLKKEGTVGNTIISKNHFLSEFKKLTGNDLKNLQTDSSVKVTSSDVANQSYVRKEYDIAKELTRLANAKEPLDYAPELISYAEDKCRIRYGKQQKEAFSVVLSGTGIKAVVGGPGTGKTSTIRGILYAYEKMYPKNRITLCASTGRAAQRMSESTRRSASTMHKLLGSGILSSSDFIVVDESSMVDTDVFRLFLKSIRSGALLLIIGDVNQLEAVGHGKVLQDVLSCRDEVLIARLTDVYRQKGGSPIVDNAVKINEGIFDLSVDKTFKVITTKNENETLEVVKKIYGESVDKRKPFDTQILCPARNGEAGVINTNKEIQMLVNPAGKAVIAGGTKFRYGDKIIMMKNNYEKGYYNGDVGIITGFQKNDVIVNIRDERFVIGEDVIDHMALAYSMTIHKSQGSEFDNVIIVLPKKPANMLVKNLIYTAVTRAKRRVWIVEEDGALKQSVLSVKDERRTTLLSGVKQAAEE